MANEIANSNTGNPYESYGDAASGSFEGDLLKFSKYGEWIFGPGAKKLKDGTRLVVQMGTLKVGWQKWLDSKPVDARMGYVHESFVACARDQLDATDQLLWARDTSGKPVDPWKFCNQIVLIPEADTDDRGPLTYSTSSRGGLRAIGQLCKAYGRRMRTHPNELPIVTLGCSSYRHDEYGEVRTPVISVCGWTSGNIDAPTIGSPNPPAPTDADFGPTADEFIPF
jgi:hypothetical protein